MVKQLMPIYIKKNYKYDYKKHYKGSNILVHLAGDRDNRFGDKILIKTVNRVVT